MNFSLGDLLLDSAGSLTQLQEAHSRRIRIFPSLHRVHKQKGSKTQNPQNGTATFVDQSYR